MFSYFVPISLLVLAGFALGLLVGRLAWASSTSAADRERQEPEAWDQGQETAWTSLGPSSHGSTQDLPVWEVREVPAAERQPTVGSLPVEIDSGRRSSGSWETSHQGKSAAKTTPHDGYSPSDQENRTPFRSGGPVLG